MNIRRIESEDDIDTALLIFQHYSMAGQFPREFDYANDHSSVRKRAEILRANAQSQYSLHFIVSREAGSVVGVGTVQLIWIQNQKWAVLENVVVVSDARGKGVGSELLNLLWKRAFDAGAQRTLASIYASNNPRAAGLARRAGMRERLVKLRWRASGDPEPPDRRLLLNVALEPTVLHNHITLHRYNCAHYLAVRGIISPHDCVEFRPEQVEETGLYIVETFVEKQEWVPGSCHESFRKLERAIFDLEVDDFRVA